MDQLQDEHPGSSTLFDWRPDPCSFTSKDWESLAECWLPVAFADEVSDSPMAATLLDVDLVIYRTSTSVVVARDICLHRGSQLTLGRLDGDELICAYHGWRYGPDGRCTRIPSQPPDRRISPHVRLYSFPVVERYGLVWTCLAGRAGRDLPEWPEAEDPSYRWVKILWQEWSTSAARQVENFLDTSHFSFVHRGTFGNPDSTEVADVDIETLPNGLRYEFPYLAVNPAESPLGEARTLLRQMVYECTLPFNVKLAIKYPERGEGLEHVIFNCASPVAARRMRVFMFLCRNFDHDVPAGELAAWDSKITAEDRPVVESQRPEELPLDLSQELHVQADKMTIAYRKALAGLGLGSAYSR